MKTSQNGIDLIKRFEGLELESYQDVAGIWTIGYGHTGPEVGPGQTLTEEEAEALLRHDLVSREKAVTRLTRVPINQNEFDALISFVYNVGIGAYERSTARRRLNNGNRMGAADALTWFNKATIGGVLREVRGLTRRRAAERALFLTPTQPFPTRDTNLDNSARVTPIEDAPRRGSISDSRTLQGAAVAGGAGVAATNMGRNASQQLDEVETQIEDGTAFTVNDTTNTETSHEAPDGDKENPEIPTLDGEDNSTVITNDSDHSEDNAATEDDSAEGDGDNTNTDENIPEITEDTVSSESTSETEGSDTVSVTDDSASDSSDDTIDDGAANNEIEEQPLPTDTTGTDRAGQETEEIDDTTDEDPPSINETPEEIVDTLPDDIPPTDETGTVVEVPDNRPAKHGHHDADAQIQLALMVVIILAVLYILFARIDDWLRYRR